MDITKQQTTVPVTALDAAHANEYFEQFVNASSMKHILGYYRGLIDSLHLRPNVFPLFYPKLRANLTSWRAKALLKKFDSRASHKCYQKGKVAANTRVLVIGGGPCGMRTAIEAQLLGAKVVVVEKRDRFSRNNVLHLWPFVIEDLRMLGAKKFFGKFCAGAIDHISIRQLQCILLKVALLLGVEIHTEVGFENLIEPDPVQKIGWRAQFKPSNHPVSQYEFDVIIGADGKRNTLQGFTRKEFRGKLAIAITANFINKKTEAEARVEEISGVAFIFNQKFFKDLQEETRIDLENIVYYKDDTHYFVMTAKKHSLIEKGVIKQDYSDTERLLAPENVDKEALQQYAIEAASFSTNYQMHNLEFAVNHYGQPDVAMFDFTSMYAAENASKVIERNGYRLLKILVGDSLLEPFWPTGSGCARGFLSSLDAAWAIRSWSMGTLSPLDTLSERESIYRLLAQTTPDNLNKDWKSYTLDPVTRYPNLNKAVVVPHQVVSLFDTDNPASIDRMKRTSNEKPNEIPKKRRRGIVDNEVLLNWLTDQLKDKEDITVTDIGSIFKDGKVLCAIIHHYRPDLLDISAITSNGPAKNNQIAIDILERDLCIPPVMTGTELTVTEDYLTISTYLTEIYDCFRGEIPYIKHPKLSLKNPKFQSYPKLKHHCTFLQPKEVPCKKCFKAYHSKASFYPNEIIEILGSHQTNRTSLSKKPFEKNEEKNMKFTYKRNCEKCIKRKKDKQEIEEMSCREKQVTLSESSAQKMIQEQSQSLKVYPQLDKVCQKNYQGPQKLSCDLNMHKIETSVQNMGRKYGVSETCSHLNKTISQTRCVIKETKPALPKMSVETLKSSYVVYDPEDLQRKCIEKIYGRNEKLKKFLTRLLLKRKISDELKRTINEAPKTNSGPNICERNGIDSRKTSKQPSLVNFKSLEAEKFECVLQKIDEKSRSSKSSKNKHIHEIKSKNQLITLFTAPTSKPDRNKPIELNINKDTFDEKVRNKFTATEEFEKFSKFCQTESNSSDSTQNIKIRYFNKHSKSKVTLQTIRYTSNHVSISSKMALRNPSRKSSSQIKVEERTDTVKFPVTIPIKLTIESPKESEESFIEKIKKSEKPFKPRSKYSLFQTSGSLKSSPSPSHFPTIHEAEELVCSNCSELPVGNTKLNEVTFKNIRTGYVHPPPPDMVRQISRPSSRHKHKHSDGPLQKPASVERKPRKRRPPERMGANIDHENKPSLTSRMGGRDEDIAAKIKHLENKWCQPQPVEKKPKDLLRAIGKIETSDWNIKEIEKKIMENKLGKPSRAIDKEKVPKWSKEQFVARQTKMEKKHYDRQDSSEAKFADIDRNIKNLEQKLKEGTSRELGTKKVATITEKLVSKIPAERKPPEKTHNRQPLFTLPTQAASEFCHFCRKRVYLMEKLSAEGRFFHHGCFKCQYCHVQLRLGSYAFDRDGIYGNRFFCLQHFGMSGEVAPVKVARKPSVKRQSENRKSPEKKTLPGTVNVDSIDKVQTPERIEFSNLSTGHISSDQEDSLNQMDEDEWTDKNFGGSCAELDDTDDDSSSISDTDSDDEDAYDDAMEEPATKEGTLKWAERWKNSYSHRKNSDSNEYSSSSSDQSSYYDTSDDDESDTATEGEEEIRARELRKQEVCVEPPIVHTDTGTDTEVVSDESSSASSNEIHNSATEISTDSEFQDDPTPTRELPSILLNDFHVTKIRGSGNVPKKIQVTSRYLQKASHEKVNKKPNIELKLSPLVSSAAQLKKPAPVALARPEGYVLNRTQSTGGIAAKVSLELKKKYLLGESSPGNIQKSGSASTLDTKFKSFHTNISDCQKMLKPSSEISASMQTFCKKLNELKSPSSSQTSILTKEMGYTEKEEEPEKPEQVPFENEPEGRPRSPLHETSIVVPQIDWGKRNESLTSDSLASSDSENEKKRKNSKPFENIPRVEIFTTQDSDQPKDDFVPDSLCFVEEPKNPSIDAPKSVTSDKKSLNQPKTLPNLENLLPEIHNSLHTKYKKLDSVFKETSANSDNLSSPESVAEQVTTALTETELSDWARDEVVSDDFEDGVFEISVRPSDKPERTTVENNSIPTDVAESVLKDKIIITEAMNSILNVNLDNIEFMDTGTETSSDDGVGNSQNGYVLFKNEDDEFASDSLNPHINDILEARNIHIDTKIDINNDFKESDPIKQANEPDDDSVVVVESGTTTEENTFTDSTVKNVTEFKNDSLMLTENNNLNEPKHSDPETIVNDEIENKDNFDNNIEFQEHCQRLKSKVEFSNAKDSIDVRKSRRKSKPDILIKPDLITEEIASPASSPKIIPLSKFHSPDILYNKEVIKKERDINQKLIQEMVMNKMKSENKSLERRKRNKTSPSPNAMFELNKSATTANIITQNASNVEQNTPKRSLFSNTQPDVLLTTKPSVKSVNLDFINSESKYSTPNKQTNQIMNINDKINDTPKAPPRYNNKKSENMDKKLEKLKQTVRLRNKENEHLLLNKTQFNDIHKKGQPRRCISDNYESVPIMSLKKDSVTPRAKSISDFPQKLLMVNSGGTDPDRVKIYKSDPNILESNDKIRRKSQDRENRKSLTKIITGFFTKRSPSFISSKGFFSKLSPKSKEISKEHVIYQQRKCLSENFIDRNITPPPVPPLPINYVRKTDDSSDGEEEFKKHHDSSCDTLDCTGASVGSTTGRRSSKSLRAIRQAQLKRHRMAQEIQRKLEETEVKMKELEDRGVQVEKAIRGEGSSDSPKDEVDLLQEWFDLMRDRTELRRFERELTVRAQELELEDRHARLQHDLRERIENEKPKSQEDVEVEESIINEMIKIVEKRDSLLSEIEEDKLRYSHENRDLEEQMLAKGLRLTPVKASPDR